MYVIRNKIVSRKVGICILVIVSVGVLSTVSRKGVVTMIMSYFFYFVLTKQFKITILLIILLSISAMFVMKEKKIAVRFQSEEISKQLTGRSRVIPIGIKLLKGNWLFGRGYKGFYNYGVGIFLNKKYDPHNNFITALVDYGLLGFFLFINIFIIPLYRSLRNLSKEELPEDPKLKGIVAISVIVPFIFNAFFAGGLMYMQFVTSILYTYFVIFAFSESTEN